MVFEFSLGDIFALVTGTVGGVLVALLLVSGKQGTKWLAAFVLIYSYALLSGTLRSLGQSSVFHAVLDWLAFINFLAIPCLFYYGMFAIGSVPRMRGIHFLPAFVIAVVIAIYPNMPWEILYWAQTLQVLIYLPVLIYLVRRYRRGLKDRFSSLSGIDLIWLERLNWGLLLLVVFDFTVFPLLAFVNGVELKAQEVNGQTVFNFLGALYILWLTRGAQQQYFVAATPMLGGAAYDKSGLDLDSAKVIADSIIRVVADEKLYLRPELNLRDLADSAGLTPHIASEVLNTAIGQSFYDFINKQRIILAKEKLQESDDAVLDIAFAVGFNNKVSFNRAFKKYVGLTPSGFRRTHMPTEKSKPRSA